MKKVSAGLIFTDGHLFLICHSTMNKFHDLPKGLIEENEDPKDACIRELKEETGIEILSHDAIDDLGIYDYMPGKDLHLFVLMADCLPPLSYLKCTSTFERYGKTFPEVDRYKYIPPKDMDLYLTKNMTATLQECFSEHEIFTKE